MFAADVELHGAIYRGSRKISGLLRRLVDRERRGVHRRRVLKPGRLKVFEKSFAPAFAAKTTLAITSETAGGVKEIRAIDPDYAGLQLCRDVQ